MAILLPRLHTRGPLVVPCEAMKMISGAQIKGNDVTEAD